MSRLPPRSTRTDTLFPYTTLFRATGADFIWAMDDDVIPDQNALQKLLDARSCLEVQSVYPPYIVSTARTPAGDLTNTPGVARGRNVRSEEHTSELQSLMRISYAVFCLKKKNIHND